MSIEDKTLPANLTAFDFNNLPVRVVVLDGQPHFIATDVCKCLDIKNTSHALTRLKDNEKGIAQNYTPNEKGTCKTRTLGGTQELLTVNEPGLYRLIFRSDKPQAEPFQDWVYHQVLPAIRATGSYTAPSAINAANTDMAALVQQEVAKQLQQLQQQHKPLQHAKEQRKATPDYFDEFMQQNATFNTEYDKKTFYLCFLEYLKEIGKPTKIRQRTVTKWAMSYALDNDFTYIARRSNGRDLFKIESDNPQTSLPMEG